MGTTVYQQSQLESLWTQAGGAPGAAPMASAIALAENSKGDPTVTHRNTDGTTDVGLWQINSSHGLLATTNPLGNAKAAVAISANGTNWRPWCTAWSDGACGTRGGTYLGAGAPFLKYLTGAVPPVTPASPAPPASTGLNTPVSIQTSGCLIQIPSGVPAIGDKCLLSASAGRKIAGAAAMGGGGLVLLIGLYMTVGGSGVPSIGRVPRESERLQKENEGLRREAKDERMERRRSKVANREGLTSPT